jgi:hypothetical protein
MVLRATWFESTESKELSCIVQRFHSVTASIDVQLWPAVGGYNQFNRVRLGSICNCRNALLPLSSVGTGTLRPTWRVMMRPPPPAFPVVSSPDLRPQFHERTTPDACEQGLR